MYTESENIKRMVNARMLALSEVEIFTAFPSYLESLPWKESGLALDWSKIPGDLLEVEMLLGDVAGRYFVNSDVLIFLLSPIESCVFCSIDFGLKSIEDIFWRAPGIRYFCGGRIDSGRLVPNFKNFAEYDGLGSVRICLSEA